MLTRPDDLEDDTIVDALTVGWGFDTATLEHQAVGFGSHHWTATQASGERLFVTIDALAAKARDADDTADAAFARLAQAFAAVRVLHDEAHLHFVVPPLEDREGNVIQRVDERYSMVVHPFVIGRNPGEFGAYDTEADRLAVLDLLVELHAATPIAAPHAAVDDLVLPHRADIERAIADLDRPWDTGPYGERSRTLLSSHAAALRVLFAAYERLAAEVRQRPERMVMTHGEPHAGNVLVTDDGHRLIDWDTARITAPERDVWGLAPGDGSIIEAYGRAAGVEVLPNAIDLYDLWWDLDEIGGYLELFRRPHGEDADAVQSWEGLCEYLQPEARWPALFR